MTDAMIADGKNNALKTFEKGELIEKVLEKHRRLINEYSSEFAELENKLVSLNEIIDSSREKKENVLSRIDILTEKRQLYYHQAEKLLDDLKANISNKPDASKELDLIYGRMLKLKGSLTPDEEKGQADLIFDKLSSMSLADVKDVCDTVRSRINEAIAFNAELHSIKGTDGDFDKEKLESEKTINEITPRHNWLMNRIGSHKDAVDYWEKISKGQSVETEVNA